MATKIAKKVAEVKKQGATAPVAKKEVKPVPVHHGHVNPKAPIRKDTGTRFAPKSHRQGAYEEVVKAIKSGKKTRVEIVQHLDKAGFPPAYLTRVMAAHPERFTLYSDGTITFSASAPVAAKKAAKTPLKKAS